MLAAGTLLIGLCLLGVQRNEANDDILFYIGDKLYHCSKRDIDYGFDATDAPNHALDTDDWLFDLIDDSSVCDPNPCFNGASCQAETAGQFVCFCPEPYMGKRCQKVRNICENVKCGHGDCVKLNQAPYYECKCKPPYSGPDCKALPSSPCEPNPCQNGGSCMKGNKRFGCACPTGFTGKFCQNVPTDCYEGNGESYRGNVTETEDGRECMDWNSYSILAAGDDPFASYSDFTGLESNLCRNPDGDDRPWCFVKGSSSLDWEYCNIKKCSGATAPPAPPLPPVQPPPGPASFSQCGKIDWGTQPVRTGRIYGGTKSFPGAHPWQVSLQKRPRNSQLDFRHDCGGILLSSCWVLTAAHCISNENEYQVAIGGVNLNKPEEMDQAIPVIETFVHENYNPSPEAFYSDIALVKLKSMDGPNCARETRFVRAACLPEENFPPGKECVISGYGATDAWTNYSPQLLNARVFMISQERCSRPEVYGPVLDNTMLCAGVLRGGTDSCQGDSGGPLVCEQNGTHYVSGVVSWGIGCAMKNKPGVYANVHTFLDWIKSKMS
ncbi:hyaluronan-binding protein 2-like [Notolabrus celidotus]|uniref:hyaluronan-binding protein 2-like n=1 Tax=Notolabrus celidotus TaxID=1203425 RepID=UPI00148F4CA6|nr:hyaluronan-binding protein 2-like [Notolabrus celidotus]